MGNKQELAA